jgi:hypothetical protein
MDEQTFTPVTHGDLRRSEYIGSDGVVHLRWPMQVVGARRSGRRLRSSTRSVLRRSQRRDGNCCVEFKHTLPKQQ